jgi:Uma2 family endonuclease
MSTATISQSANAIDSSTATARLGPSIPPLENGAHLSASEFLRRYEAMPDVKKAELIQGVVYMSSPVRARAHAKPDHMMQGWMWSYEVATPCAEAYSNSTVRFGADDIPQPDITLCILPKHGGKSYINAKDYIVGSPELVVEIAASSASYDMKEKLETYRRFGVRELVLWLTEENRIIWLHLEDDEYRALSADLDGIIKSRVFPGLWLDVAAMLAFDKAGVLSVLARGLASAEHAAFIQ